MDAPVFGIRRADIKNKFSLPSNLKMANFTDLKSTQVESQGGSGINEYVTRLFDQSLTWKDLEWLIRLGILKMFLKLNNS